jgi:hypothetical protein
VRSLTLVREGRSCGLNSGVAGSGFGARMGVVFKIGCGSLGWKVKVVVLGSGRGGGGFTTLSLVICGCRSSD